MCTGLEIAAIAGLVLSTAAAVVNHEQQQDMAEANAAAAKRNHDFQMAALQDQRTQINQQAGEKMSEIAKAEQARMAQLRVAAGESGVAGVSLGRLENEIELEAGQDMASIEANRRNAMNQTSRQAAGVAAQAINQANAVPKPSWGVTALRIASGAVDAYAMGAKGSQASSMTKSTSGVQVGAGGP